MDDPWGSSPWADEVQHPVTATKVEHTAGNDVGPKKPVKASNLGLDVKAHSPWNDEDDGFGDLGAMPTAEEVRSNGAGLYGAGDGWKFRETVDARSTTKQIDFDGLSWNDDMPSGESAVSRLAPSLMPNSLPVLRQPSPDPWATGTTLDNEEHVEDTPRLEARKQVYHTFEGELHIGLPEPLQGSNDKSLSDLLPEPDDTTCNAETTDKNELGKPNSDEPRIEPEITQKIEEEVDGHDADRESSRPSSSPSDQSHHDEILPESPRTSLDEEPKRPQVIRKVSTKIQELVEHFDGLAKEGEELVIESSRSRSRSETPSLPAEIRKDDYEETMKEDEKVEQGDDDEDDFGDFEDGQSEAGGSIVEEVKRPITPPPAQSQLASSPTFNMISPQSSPPLSRYVEKDFGRVEFEVVNSILHNFYSQAGGDDTPDTAVEKVLIKDTVPYDSFQSLEERKTWYRLSRYGSMRKHDSGDDDNYVRVTWRQSQVREQTLKTVARWMEEDRISGRVVLGGGRKGSSIFGWNDSNAAPVPLTSAFATKPGRKPTPISSTTEATSEVPREWRKSLVRNRSRSKSRSPPKANRRGSTKRESISETHKGSPQAPVASFGWSAIPTVGEQKAIPLLKESPKSPLLDENQASTSRQPASISQRSVNPATMQAKAIQAKPLTFVSGSPIVSAPEASSKVVAPILSAISNDDDDDWGEMVASPTLPVAPVLPPSQDLLHKKSQSLGGAFSPPQCISRVDLPILPQSARSHKFTISFDELMIPRSRNTLDSRSDPFPSAASASAISPITQAPALPVSSATSSHDPWASADFSFFDSPPSALPSPKSVAAPVSKATPKAVPFTKAPPAPSPLRHRKTRQEVEQDELVAGIVRSLPDLMYMLRR